MVVNSTYQMWNALRYREEIGDFSPASDTVTRGALFLYFRTWVMNMYQVVNSIAVTAVLAAGFWILGSQNLHAQRQQYKIQEDGVVLKLQRVNVTTFRYVPFAQAELRTDAAGRSFWYFKAETGKEYTAVAPDQPPAPQRYNAAQLNAALALAKERGEIPTAAKVETFRGEPTFLVKFERNTLGLNWHAQVAMPAQEYEIVNRTLSQQGYVKLFAEPYLAGDRSTRFLAAWRK